MESVLRNISELALEINKSVFTEEQRTLKWLGNEPAKIEDIISAENRLGIELPVDYKNFLLITNGFFTPADITEPTFESVEKIDYLKNIDTFLLEVWNQLPLLEVTELLSRSIVIGGINDEQYFLIIPPKEINEEWKYWKFANWIPGEQPYNNMKEYFDYVLDFMNDLYKERR